MIENQTNKPAHARSTHPFLKGADSKMLYNSGQRTSRFLIATSLKPLENALVWLVGLIVACGIFRGGRALGSSRG
ncbi:hypothetical protein NL64_04595 [Pseudomonas fluorescens]|uniref:hypothetical protein n=1 Tax=Pseudomonas fluorescens TaxID=294 RepID=UPI00054B3637|nr:hypothetical protein [Pseudomonas fluorescens]KII36144.1 hypothetical protein NL64_04595 [Pseudomonas fluorescens]